MSVLLRVLAALLAAVLAGLGAWRLAGWLSAVLDDAFDYPLDGPETSPQPEPLYATGGYLPAGYSITVNRHPDEHVLSAAQVRAYGLRLFGDPRGETA